MKKDKSFMTPTLLMTTFALAIASFMNVLDATIVNVSLSHMAGDFGVTSSQATWFITSYAVSEAILLPLVGWLTTRFGLVKQFVWSTLLFTLASAMCGIAPNFNILLIGRVLQGVVGASMIPLSQTLMMQAYPEDKKNIGLGIWSMTVMMAPVVGPMLGGFITDTLSWRWCFYINLPIDIVSSALVYYIYKKNGYVNKVSKQKVDIFGLICLIIGIGALQIMLDKGHELDWFANNEIKLLTLIAFVFIIILIIWEYYQKNPVVDIKLFFNRNFAIGSLTMTVAFSILSITVVVLPLWLQNFMGYSAARSGAATATAGLVMMLLTPIIATKIGKIDPRYMAISAFLVWFLASFTVSKYSVDTTMSYVARSRLWMGLGMALFFLPLNSIAMSEINNKDMANASGLFNFMRNLGQSIGASISTSYWSNRMSLHHEELVASISSNNINYLEYSSKIPMPERTILAIIDSQITQQAAAMGITDIMQITGICILILIPLVLLAKRPTKIVTSSH